MNRPSRRRFLERSVAGGLALWATGLGSPLSAPASDPQKDDPFRKAAASAKIAGYSFSKVQRWLKEKALPVIDDRTGLYRADGQWNYHNTAADCYPFLCWAAHLVDRKSLDGPVLEVLEAEQRLCNHVDRIPVSYDWSNNAKVESTTYDQLVFGASEYVKDGLIAIVEVTGRGPWYERMKGIEEDLWKNAQIDTPFGKIVSTNVEVNGEQIQALVRLFTMSGDERFLVWAERLADHYFSQEDFVPSRLRDHGCEIIGGLGLLAGVESEVNPSKAAKYLPRLKRMFDEILARGTNEHGLMYNALGNPNSGLSDGWGYNYVGNLCYDMAAEQPVYRKQIETTLSNLLTPVYENYAWEGRSIDGFADSIEGCIYLLNRVPVAEGFAWVDREMARNVVRSYDPLDTAPLWGTMKLESNGVRTVIMHALMHTQGLIARPWRRDLGLGAVRVGDNALAIVMTAKEPWQGHLEFDIPRHRHFMGFQHDWPRMNTLPEWYTVEADQSYRVRFSGSHEVTLTGRELSKGMTVRCEAGKPQKIEVIPT